MHKRVLVAESAEAVRSVAESILRQNGFEVISVESADKASEVLQFTVPDIMILGVDLVCGDGLPLHEKVQADPKTGDVPLMIFDNPDSSEEPPVSQEAVIPRPFDPKEMVQQVLDFLGEGPLNGAATAAPILAEDDNPEVDDFLDAALGLDNLDVTGSEVMNKTGGVSGGKGAAREKNNEDFLGLTEEDDSQSDSGKVESLMIREGDAKNPTTDSDADSGGGLEIMDDQYGITADPGEFEPDSSSSDHDYDWFINSMREEVSSGENARPSARRSRAEKLDVEQTASKVDPVTPYPGKSESKKAAGVEKFIDEFRQEMERIRSTDEPESVTVREDAPKPGKAEEEATAVQTAEHNWEDHLEKVTPKDLSAFTRQFASELADSLSRRIMEKIDDEKLLRLIAAEMSRRLRSEREV